MTLEALNHDLKISGLIPFVVLMSEIPNTLIESFFSERPFFTTKDKVFGLSNPFNNGAKLAMVLA